MSMIRTTAPLLLLSSFCLLAAPLSAETLSPQGAGETASASADLMKYSQQLNSSKFSERRLASQELAAAGVRALPVLEQAALGHDREASARAMTIIQQQYAGGDESTRRQAEEYLQRISESDNEFAARRADESLNPQQNTPNQFNPVFGNVMRGNRVVIQAAQAQRLQIQIGAQPAQVRRVQIRNANGEKSITVTENNRTITVNEKKNSLVVTIKTTNGDKTTTEKFEAKDAEELKKKHPKAYEVYKKYNRGGGIKIQANFQMPKAKIQALQPQIRLPNIKAIQPIAPR